MRIHGTYRSQHTYKEAAHNCVRVHCANPCPHALKLASIRIHPCFDWRLCDPLFWVFVVNALFFRRVSVSCTFQFLCLSSPMFSMYYRLPLSLSLQSYLLRHRSLLVVTHLRALTSSLPLRQLRKLAAPHRTLLIQSFILFLSDVDALPSPFTSTNNDAPGSMECASSLTQRALRYQRRDTLRTAQYDTFPASFPVGSNVILLSSTPARVRETIPNMA